MTSLLTIRDLCITFRTEDGVVEAVKNVSLEVGEGETLALVGESGSGKSLTALSTVQLLPGSAEVSGSIDYRGTQMLKARPADLRRVRGNDISFIFQEPMTSLNPLHTIEKQIGESLALHQGLRGTAARGRIIELLNRVGVRDAESRLDAWPHQLSGGQRQRVMIAMALANRPDLLVAGRTDDGAGRHHPGSDPGTACQVAARRRPLDACSSRTTWESCARWRIASP